jgi:hypothetical protein
VEATEAAEDGAEDGAPVPCVPAGAEPVAEAGAAGVAVADPPGAAGLVGDTDPVGVAEAAVEAEFAGVAELAGAVAVADQEPEGDVVGAACVGVAAALVPVVRFWSAPASVSVFPL